MCKRILITSFTFPPKQNGVSHVVEAHATGLARLGHDVTVVTGLYPGSSQVDMWEGVKVRRFDTRGNGRWIIGGYSGDIAGYQDFIASFDGDLIICHCWQIWSTDLAVQVFERIHCPKVLVSHGVGATISRKTLKGLILWLVWRPYIFKMRRMLPKFDHVVVLSDQINSKSFFDHRLMHHINYKKHNMIPNGAYRERFTVAVPRAEGFRTQHFIGKKLMLLYVANYGEMKNQEMAVDVFFEAAPENAVLVLIGTEINDYARHLQLLTRKYDPEGRQVIFLERQAIEDISAAYCASDLFLCTSKHEVQPLVILEAMAAGKPFVCTDVGCVRDMPGGIVVSDKSEMVRAIRGLMADEPRRSELGRKGRMAIDEHYTWDRIVKQYDGLIAKLCP